MFGQVGEGNNGQLGVVDTFTRFTGVVPPPPHLVVKRGDCFAPSCAVAPLGPRTPPKKNKKGGCVLGMGCGGLASASELLLTQVGAILVEAIAVVVFYIYSRMAEQTGRFTISTPL